MMSEHRTSTPGPWRVYKHDPLVIVAGDGFSVCDTSPGNPIDLSLGEAAGNARKIVRAVNAYDELCAALEPFADVNGEGDEDFPDSTRVTVTYGRTIFYALRLGDFRRARAAFDRAEAAGDRTAVPYEQREPEPFNRG